MPPLGPEDGFARTIELVNDPCANQHIGSNGRGDEQRSWSHCLCWGPVSMKRAAMFPQDRIEGGSRYATPPATRRCISSRGPQADVVRTTPCNDKNHFSSETDLRSQYVTCRKKRSSKASPTRLAQHANHDYKVLAPFAPVNAIENDGTHLQCTAMIATTCFESRQVELAFAFS